MLSWSGPAIGVAAGTGAGSGAFWRHAIAVTDNNAVVSTAIRRCGIMWESPELRGWGLESCRKTARCLGEEQIPRVARDDTRPSARTHCPAMRPDQAASLEPADLVNCLTWPDSVSMIQSWRAPVRLEVKTRCRPSGAHDGCSFSPSLVRYFGVLPLT